MSAQGLVHSGARGRRVRAAPLDVADAARTAGSAFLVGVRDGWDKAELAAWLIGVYGRATAFTAEEARSPEAGLTVATAVPQSLDSLLDRARVEILEALDGAAYGRGKPAFVEQAIALGSVTPFVWLPGVRGWAPRDRARLRLRDRVLSLFAADYLVRPESYARELFVCPDCLCAVFDEEAVARAKCPLHDRPSGIRPQESLEERVDDLLRVGASLDVDDLLAASADARAVFPGSYRMIAGEPYTTTESPDDRAPQSEPVILLRKKAKSA